MRKCNFPDFTRIHIEIRYEKLKHGNFGGRSLDEFIRHQTIRECWRKVDGELKLVTNEFAEDCPVEKCREVAAGISCRLEKNLSAFGAFCCIIFLCHKVCYNFFVGIAYVKPGHNLTI